jgi:hypothetical protein
MAAVASNAVKNFDLSRAIEVLAEMDAAIQEASEESIRTCEVCGAPGVLEERHAWWSPRCKAHETWTPWDNPAWCRRACGQPMRLLAT